MQKIDIILLNGQVIFILYSLLIRQEYMLSRLVSFFCGVVHLNLFGDLNQWYNPYGERMKGKQFPG